MATRKKANGIAAIVAKQEPVSIQDLTMQDFFAAFALQGMLSHYGDSRIIESDRGVMVNVHDAAYDHAEEMMKAREA